MNGILVTLSGRTSPNDGGGGCFYWEASSTQADDDATVINPLGNATGRWLRLISWPISPLWWGASAGDWTVGINKALTWASLQPSGTRGGYVALPPGTYSCSGTVIVPDGVTLTSLGFSPCLFVSSTNPSTPLGTVLSFSNNVSPCIILGSQEIVPYSSLGGNALKQISITRESPHLPPPRSIGVQVRGPYAPILEDVLVYGHAQGYVFKTDGIFGNAAFCTRIFSAGITDSHMVIDGWPEIRVSQSRFGSNGLADRDCNAYVRISNVTTAGNPAGPNTVVFENCQFNQGSGEVTAALDWRDLKSGGPIIPAPPNPTFQGSIITEFKWIGCHFENWRHAIQTDSSVQFLTRLTLIGNTFLDNFGTASFWNLFPGTSNTQPGTSLSHVNIVGGEIVCGEFSINASPFQGQTNGLNVIGVSFPVGKTRVSGSLLTGQTSSTVNFVANAYAGGLDISGSFAQANFGGTGSPVTNNAGGVISIEVPNGESVSSWSPILLIGGEPSTVAAIGQWQLVGNLVTYSFEITVREKGGGTGAVSIAGLPLESSSTIGGAGGGGLTYSVNMEDLPGTIIGEVSQGGTVLNLFVQTTTGIGTLNESNLTDASYLYGSGSYFI